MSLSWKMKQDTTEDNIYIPCHASLTTQEGGWDASQHDDKDQTLMGNNWPGKGLRTFNWNMMLIVIEKLSDK